ncbi:MAG TPA: hypothetical protein VII71_02115 [Verrucomicrobiae bacterium]
MRKLYVITAAVLMAASIVGCSKSSSRPSTTESSDKPLSTTATVLELSTNTPSRVTIDRSHDCIITTTAIQGGQLLLRLDYKTTEPVKPTPPVKLILSPDQEFTIQTEGMAAPLRFKAKLKAE